MNRQIRLLKFISSVETQLRADGRASMPNDDLDLASDVYDALRERYRNYDLQMSKVHKDNAVMFLSADYLGSRL